MKNPFTINDLPIEEMSTDAVAADVTSLLAASSFVDPFSGRKDPRAGLMFEIVTTDYCSGSKLIMPLPETTWCEGTVFIDLWAKDSAAAKITGLELTDSVFQKLSNALAPRLAAYIEGDPHGVAEWIAFQFTPHNEVRHIQRSRQQALIRAGPLACQLLDKNHLREFRKALIRTNIITPESFQNLVGMKEIPGLAQLCVAYVISLALRRFSYANGISSCEDNPIYRYHWIGNPIMLCDFLPGTLRSEEEKPVTRFPWGKILRKLIDSEKSIAVSKVEQILIGLREGAAAFQREYARLPVSEDVSAAKLTEREALVIETLLNLGVEPRYASTTRAEHLAGWLRSLADFNPACKLIIERVTANLQAKWARNVEAGFRLHFRKDNFWDVFENIGINCRKTKTCVSPEKE